ncbi:MAG TPA: hypothetical protein VES69_03365, partial [Pyrinomonadaceae bacterium]|nr:hypothetical protein [Pyrinomonadaceae bacterium]
KSHSTPPKPPQRTEPFAVAMDPSIQPLQERTQPQRKSINQVDTDRTLEQAGLVVNQGNVKRSPVVRTENAT